MATNQTLALSSNQTTFQPGSDLWSLTEKPTAGGVCVLLWWINGFISVRKFQKNKINMVTFMMQIIFWKTFKRSSVVLYVVDLQLVSCHQQRLFTAGGFAKCSHCVAPPIRPFAWADLMWIQRTDSAASGTVLCSFLLGLKQIEEKKIRVFFFLFYKLWILSWWHWVITDIKNDSEASMLRSKFAKHLFCK